MLTSMTEEFGIYLNYVRKLGFEETPDYEFLRELFAKVMKSNNDVDDGVFDWNLLNGTFVHVCLCYRFHLSISLGGKGWEASVVSFHHSPARESPLNHLLFTGPDPDPSTDAKRRAHCEPARSPKRAPRRPTASIASGRRRPTITRSRPPWI